MNHKSFRGYQKRPGQNYLKKIFLFPFLDAEKNDFKKPAFGQDSQPVSVVRKVFYTFLYHKKADKGSESGPPVFSKIIAVFLIILLFILNIRAIYKKYYPEPATAQEYHILAKSLGIKDKLKEAEKAAKKSLAIDPKFAKAYMDLGNIYTYQGEYIKAERAYKLALEYVGNDKINREVIYYDLGGIYEREKRVEESWEYFLKAYEIKSYLSPQYWEKDADSPVKYVIKNDKDGFIKYIQEEIGVPKEVSEREREIKKYIGLNNRKVVTDCREYLKDNPGSKYSYLFIALMASALLRMDRVDEAIDKLKMLEDINLPEHYVAWLKHTYGYIFYHQKNYTAAMKYFQDVVKNHPNYKSIGQVESLIREIREINK